MGDIRQMSLGQLRLHALTLRAEVAGLKEAYTRAMKGLGEKPAMRLSEAGTTLALCCALDCIDDLKTRLRDSERERDQRRFAAQLDEKRINDLEEESRQRDREIEEKDSEIERLEDDAVAADELRDEIASLRDLLARTAGVSDHDLELVMGNPNAEQILREWGRS